jgi:hypothetical protein
MPLSFDVIGARAASGKDVDPEDLAIVAHGDWAGPQNG